MTEKRCAYTYRALWRHVNCAASNSIQHKCGRGKVMKKEPREQTTLRLPAELKERLLEEAGRKGISLNSYILLLIDIGRQNLQG